MGIVKTGRIPMEIAIVASYINPLVEYLNIFITGEVLWVGTY